VISEWITWAIIRAGRRRETNHNRGNRYSFGKLTMEDLCDFSKSAGKILSGDWDVFAPISS